MKSAIHDHLRRLITDGDIDYHTDKIIEIIRKDERERLSSELDSKCVHGGQVKWACKQCRQALKEDGNNSH